MPPARQLIHGDIKRHQDQHLRRDGGGGEVGAVAPIPLYSCSVCSTSRARGRTPLSARAVVDRAGRRQRTYQLAVLSQTVGIIERSDAHLRAVRDTALEVGDRTWHPRRQAHRHRAHRGRWRGGGGGWRADRRGAAAGRRHDRQPHDPDGTSTGAAVDVVYSACAHLCPRLEPRAVSVRIAQQGRPPRAVRLRRLAAACAAQLLLLSATCPSAAFAGTGRTRSTLGELRRTASETLLNSSARSRHDHGATAHDEPPRRPLRERRAALLDALDAETPAMERAASGGVQAPPDDRDMDSRRRRAISCAACRRR